MRTNFILFLIISSFFACDNPELQKQLEAANTQIETLKADLDKANQAKIEPKTTFIHTVYFWMKEGITEEETTSFLKDLNSLSAVANINDFYVGPPAKTSRGVIDNSYSHALIIHFPTAEAQDAYQVDQIHLDFIEKQKDNWVKVVVYDSLVQ